MQSPFASSCNSASVLSFEFNESNSDLYATIIPQIRETRRAEDERKKRKTKASLGTTTNGSSYFVQMVLAYEISLS